MEGDKQKLVFWIQYGLFQFTVLHFGTTNADTDLKEYENYSMYDALDDFASAYLNNIQIYCNSEEEHIKYIECVIKCIAHAGFYLEPE